MKILIQSVAVHRGFKLDENIEFEGSICAITGKNGVGKTRLLQSLANGTSRITIDNVEVDTTQVTLLDMSNERPQILTTYSYSNFASNISKSILSVIEKLPEGVELPLKTYCHMGDYMGPPDSEEVYLRDIITRAEETFKKPISDIGAEELELSVLLNKE
ncbi:MAG: ATP-binding cassette domain-containing protein, partial [Enterobacteriaceae bacterium]